jgi:hypothetical protein
MIKKVWTAWSVVSSLPVLNSARALIDRIQLPFRQYVASSSQQLLIDLHT